MIFLKKFVRYLLGDERYAFFCRIMLCDDRSVNSFFVFYKKRLLAYSGAFGENTREKALSKLIATYHVVEKGLTMPNRRFVFAKRIICDLMDLVKNFENEYGEDPQVIHSIGVVRAYWDMHYDAGKIEDADDGEYWREIKRFIDAHANVQAATQQHMTKSEFYSKREASFPEFAFARHTLRHYADSELSVEKIKQAVALATSTPSACNRQYCRVYCVSDKEVMSKLLEIQGGNRGFGHLANKVLVVTADLQGIGSVREHNDLFTNGGMFLMNFCYALYYYQIAHCILNWSKSPTEDMAMRKLIPIKDSESVIALLTCGETPDEFDVASSPRKSISDVFMSL